MKYEAILFDLDGTLLDTLQDIADSLNFILTKAGYPTHPLENVRRFVGNGSRRLLEAALPKDVPQDVLEDCLAQYVAYYKTHAQIKTAPYPGILELMDRVRQMGYRTAVVSNKPDGAVKPMCQTYFPGRVDVAQGEDEQNGIRTKPHPDSTLAAMKTLNVTPDKCLYVGDSEVDLMTAQNAHMDCLSVSWGFRTREQLLENGAKHIADRVADFIPVMEKMQLERENPPASGETPENLSPKKKKPRWGIVLPLLLIVAGLTCFGWVRPALQKKGINADRLREMPLLMQGDYRETVAVFGGQNKSVATSGCGAACMGMALTYLTNRPVSPEDLFRWAYQEGYYYGDGLGHEALTDMAEKYGMEGCWLQNTDTDAVLDALGRGYPVVAHMGPGVFTYGGHYILLRGVDEEGRILVNDPQSRENTDTPFDLNLICQQLRRESCFMVAAPKGETRRYAPKT